MKKKPSIDDVRVVAESRLFAVEEIDLTFSNGEKRTYERLKGQRSAGSVLVVPILDEHTLILIREYAAGTDRYELAFPKGLMEPDESPMAAANRELKEETSFHAESIIPLKRLSTAPGYMGAQMHMFLATQLSPQTEEGDEPEPIEVVHWPLSNIGGLLKEPDFTEARSVAALFLALQELNLPC